MVKRDPGSTVVRGAAQAAALLKPDRLRLLRELAEPDSAAGLARKLGWPRQRINYHLHQLEKAGLVELVEERRRGGLTERVVRAVARSYLISPEVLGSLGTDPEAVRDRFSSSYLVALAARTLGELAALRGRAERAGQRLATLALESEVRFATAADRNAFAEELATEVARLAAKYHAAEAPRGRLYRLVVGAYPAITKPEEPPADATASVGSNVDPKGGETP